MTDPGPGMPQFTAVGYVDGKAFGNYDSERRTVRPIVDWLPREDREHWDAETKKARSGELDFYVGLGWLREHYNKSGGERAGSCGGTGGRNGGRWGGGLYGESVSPLRPGCAPPAVLGHPCWCRSPWDAPFLSPFAPSRPRGARGAPQPEQPLTAHPGCASGSHTLQKMFGCDILEDGSVRGYDQYAFDGRDYIAFEMDTMTFTAANAVAQSTKRKWESEGTYAERWKHELGTVCVENLRRYLEHGKAVLKRRERPEVRVRGKEADGILTLSCRAHSFYPRPITISWMKDGVVQDQETHWGGIVPNSDGTYHASATIDVPPGDWDKYQCRVEHASLLQSSFFSWELQPNLILIVAGAIITVVAVVAVVAGLVVWRSKSGKDEKCYRAELGE
uniref:Ig-like domain-containing protein n=1 Tax=Meleagris gallopavo TaxID=9103 RepID=A0A803YDD6_MELGA